MTVVICQYVGIALFAMFTVYGLIGTLRSPDVVPFSFNMRGEPVYSGHRWILFALIEAAEAGVLLGLLTGPSPRPESDIKSGAIILVAALCLCAAIQTLIFAAARTERQTLSTPRLWTALMVFGAILVGAHALGPNLP